MAAGKGEEVKTAVPSLAQIGVESGAERECARYRRGSGKKRVKTACSLRAGPSGGVRGKSTQIASASEFLSEGSYTGIKPRPAGGCARRRGLLGAPHPTATWKCTGRKA